MNQRLDCMNMRLAAGDDALRETSDDYVLVECLNGMHKGTWIAWGNDGKVVVCGSEKFVRGRLDGMVEALRQEQK